MISNTFGNDSLNRGVYLISGFLQNRFLLEIQTEAFCRWNCFTYLVGRDKRLMTDYYYFYYIDNRMVHPSTRMRTLRIENVILFPSTVEALIDTHTERERECVCVCVAHWIPQSGHSQTGLRSGSPGFRSDVPCLLLQC